MQAAYASPSVAGEIGVRHTECEGRAAQMIGSQQMCCVSSRKQDRAKANLVSGLDQDYLACPGVQLLRTGVKTWSRMTDSCAQGSVCCVS